MCNSSGSMYNFRAHTLRYLLNMNFDVIVVAPKDESSKLIVEMGCTFIHMPMNPKGVNPFADLVLLFKLSILYYRVKPNLIFHFTIKPNIYGSIASGIFKIPSVAVVTGLGYAFINDNIISRFARILYKIGLSFSNEVWFLNSDDKDFFVTSGIIAWRRAFILPGEGIDTDFYAYSKPNQKSTFTFLFIGRLLVDKGIREYVCAARMMYKKQPNCKFLIVGDCDAKNPTVIKKSELDEWMSDGYIEYLGTTTDVRKFIANADCVVLPSYREGLPRVLLEAASIGRAIIATDAPGCKDVVKHEINGFLCKIKDVNDLYRQMHKIISSEYETIIRLGIVGRDMILSKYGVDTINNIYLERIKKIIGVR